MFLPSNARVEDASLARLSRRHQQLRVDFLVQRLEQPAETELQ